MVNVQEIKNYLPDATDEQARRFAEEVERLEHLQGFFKKYPDEHQRFKEQLLRAEKALQYRQPYRIAVIGITGAGKSTLVNALLGRELVLTKALDKPATGAALYIFLDVAQGEPETAIIEYRDEADIRQLIGQFIERYKLAGTSPTGRLDTNFSQALQRLEPRVELDDLALKKFRELRDTLADIVKQYANSKSSDFKSQFSLSNTEDIKDLMRLIDENSEINSENSPFRQIGLIKSVTYHIQPDSNLENAQALKIPKNVCLVDLPGLDGSSFHDLIITEGIKGADAVIFILRPPRLLSGGDTYLRESIKRYIGLEGSVESGERIFIVLNAKDSIMTDQVPGNLPQNMRDLIEGIVQGYTSHPNLAKRGGNSPYFLTSAWAALQAQKVMKGQTLEDPNKYRTVAIDLGVENGTHNEILIASQIPKLVDELTQFARDRRIEGQLREGKLALSQITKTLQGEYESQLEQLTRNRGRDYLDEKTEAALKEQQENLKKIVTEFRKTQQQHFERWKGELQKQALVLCGQIDDFLRGKMPKLWKNNSISGSDRLHFQDVVQVNYRPVITEIEILLWQQLDLELPKLANFFLQVYQDELESSRLLQQITKSCYDTDESKTLASEIQAWIDESMRPMLKAIAGRVGLTQMVNPDQYFTSESNTKGQNIGEILTKIPAESPKPEDFSPLIAALRQHYEPFVRDYTVEGLIHLYAYEMILIEDKLLNRIKEIFRTLSKTHDAVLRERILASITDPEVGRVELLNRKLADLNPS